MMNLITQTIHYRTVLSKLPNKCLLIFTDFGSVELLAEKFFLLSLTVESKH